MTDTSRAGSHSSRHHRRGQAAETSVAGLARAIGVVLAAVVVAASVLAPGSDGSGPSGAPAAADEAVAVGVVGPSTVEMLGNESGSGVVTLKALRRDLFAWEGDFGDGSGIDIALIDTGVAPVAGLDGEDKVLHGPDLSFEGSTPEVAYLDTYGHGTHLAGIIAGERRGHEGIAPGARIVSVKTAGHDGRTTVPQVVAAIDWVVEHRNHDGLNIRVLNLSLGQSGVSSHVGDHLSAAVERAWEAGIVVVVAAGNDGAVQSHLDSPAIDPYVIAVGSVDSTNGRWNKTSRAVPAWSATGTDSRSADFVAPGRSIASYRVPGSTIDTLAPAARLGDDLFLGSGTSQSAAVTSGVAALLVAAHPDLTPDEVKASIERQSFNLDGIAATRQGDGHLDGSASVGNWPTTWLPEQSFTPAAGGQSGIVVPTGATWSGGSWSGATWSGATWSGATWSGATWSGATWSGATWSGATWSGATWSGATWSGATWSGATWSGATWSGDGWR